MAKIIDIEASGLHADSYPVEIGVYDMEDPSKSISVLIKPHKNWTFWDYNAEHIHGLARDYVEQDGIAIETVIEILQQYEGEVLYSDAPSYEMFWLDVLYDAARLERPFDVKSIYNLINVDEHPVYDRLMFSETIPHRALADAKIIAKNLKKVLDSQGK